MTINPIRGDLINLEEALQELHTLVGQPFQRASGGAGTRLCGCLG